MSIKNIILLCLGVSMASIIITRYYFPQVQTKTVEVTKEVIHNDVQTVTHTVTSPNGTTDTTVTTVDHSTHVETNNKISIVSKQPNWLISGSAATDFTGLKPIYGLQASRRILGPVYLGALLNTNHEVGLSIGFEF